MLLSGFESGTENRLSDWKVWIDAGGVYDETSETSIPENFNGWYLEWVFAWVGWGMPWENGAPCGTDESRSWDYGGIKVKWPDEVDRAYE